MNTAAENLTDQQANAISRLFSSALLREIAAYGRSPLFARLARELEPLSLAEGGDPVKNFLDKAFQLLKKRQYRTEYVYKAALTHKILLGTHSLNSAVLLNEFRVGDNKADTVILNGTATVYEVKSERDTLARLSDQITSYRRVFARVNVISGKNHVEEILDTVPSDVGVMLLSDRYQISTLRDAQESLCRVCPAAIFDSIQQKEAIRILENCGLKVPNLPNTQMYEALREQFCKISPERTHAEMVGVLKSTRSLANLGGFLESVPYSLKPAILARSIRKKEQEKVLEAINTPVCQALKWN